ncbi:hypothetical protein [Streptomyces sp. CB03234]|uniref:hypothetical protein n=1 Tax=Streptomyces sp. (strain CB03234) TaxID=1703937 RepID=UPI000939F4EF|nr:hypothetical protein [Streptomyces sp. CB03234]
MATPSRDARLDELDSERSALLELSGEIRLGTGTARDHLATLPRSRFASHAYRTPHHRPYLQPRGGFPTTGRQRELTLAFHEAGADFIPLTVDSHTRHNDYAAAARHLKTGVAEGRDLLNGYPLIAHGHLATRELYQGVDRPVSLRHGTPDARLLVETALAAGITDIEGGGLCYTLPYSRDHPLDQALMHWQYVDRLCAVSGPPGLPVHRESFGPLTATLVPPAIVVAVQLCELLLAAEQGVTSFSVGFGHTGSLEQDLATARVLRDRAGALLARFGFEDVHVSLVYHQWMGAFPVEASLAWQLIAVCATAAALMRADKVVVKTPEEALGIPSVEANSAAVRAVRYVLDMFPEGGSLSGETVDEEAALIGSEVDRVLEHVFDDPSPAFAQSVFRAVLAGVIDVPFAPHEQNASRLVTERGAGRRIRILDPGSVPVSAADLRRERQLAGSGRPQEGPLWERLLNDLRVLA